MSTATKKKSAHAIVGAELRKMLRKVEQPEFVWAGEKVYTHPPNGDDPAEVIFEHEAGWPTDFERLWAESGDPSIEVIAYSDYILNVYDHR